MFNNMELRKLPAGSLYSIVDILETNEDWKRVMAIIPKDPLSEEFEPKYNNEHLSLIEENAKATGKRCAEILFEEWSTSGRVRPTLKTLRDIVEKANIYRAADIIAVMMCDAQPERPNDGPAAVINTDVTLILENESKEQRLRNMDACKTDFIGKSANNKVTRQIGEENRTGNRTTAQMKSSSNLIKFFTDVLSSDIPKLSAFQSQSDKTTKQMKSATASDLIKFSNSQTPVIEINEPTLQSADIPKFSALQDTTEWAPTATQSTTASSQSNTEIHQGTLSEPSSNVYQMSLPNIEFDSTTGSGIDSSILQDTNLIHFEYSVLDDITNNFAEKVTVGPNGMTGCIGSGGFGEVFVGTHSKYGVLAVKKSHNNFSTNHKPDIAIKVFNAEVRNLSQFRHKNIVPIIGFSHDGPALCVVCEYIDGGSLEQAIAAKKLNAKQRIEIMLGTAEGLKYLHRSDRADSDSYKTESDSKKSNFVHGDVKSANILLTKDYVPKLCDFGLAKQFDQTCYETTSPIGTYAYMAPEGFNGTITQKMDIYSFGIVLLELLTGLRPIVANNSEKINIRDYVEENCENDNIRPLVDPVVSEWTKANEVHGLAVKCLAHQRKNRPTIDEVCDVLYTISQ